MITIIINGRNNFTFKFFRFLIIRIISINIFTINQKKRIVIARKNKMFQYPPGFLSQIGRSLINPINRIERTIVYFRLLFMLNVWNQCTTTVGGICSAEFEALTFQTASHLNKCTKFQFLTDPPHCIYRLLAIVVKD